MSPRGVFAVDRGVWDHPLFASRVPLSRREAWLWLISEASWKSRVKRVGPASIELMRGELAHSIRFIAEAWGWPKSNVARFLRLLKSETMINTETVHGVSVVTICKYDEYQRVSLPDWDSCGTTAGTAVGQSWDKQEDIKNIETTTSLRSVAARDRPKREHAKPRTALPDLWLPDERDVEHATQAGFSHEKIQRMASAFADYHRAKATLSADWNASWRTWCSNEIKFNGEQNGHRFSNNRTNHAAGSAQTRDTAVLAGMGRALERRRAARVADDPGRQVVRGGVGAVAEANANDGAAADDDEPPRQLGLLIAGHASGQRRR
jgi:hypothetical protein